jgi:hypothetical protein
MGQNARAHDLPEIVAEAQCLPVFAQAVTVGRIDHEQSWRGWNFVLAEGSHREAHIAFDLRAHGIATSTVHGKRSAIGSENRRMRDRAREQGFAHKLPRLRVEGWPVFESKLAAEPGRDPARHGCGLDGDGARTTHGIHERQGRVVFAQGQNARS